MHFALDGLNNNKTRDLSRTVDHKAIICWYEVVYDILHTDYLVGTAVNRSSLEIYSDIWRRLRDNVIVVESRDLLLLLLL